MGHRNDYSVIVFFGRGMKPKKWFFVHKLSTFRNFLDREHKGWKYMNVYDRRKKVFLKQLQRSEMTPQFIDLKP